MRLDPQPPFSVGVATTYECQREAQASFRLTDIFFQFGTTRPTRPSHHAFQSYNLLNILPIGECFRQLQLTFHKLLKVVCHLALAIWSYWHGCREWIFLNISNASNPMETPSISHISMPPIRNLPRRVIDAPPTSFHSTNKQELSAKASIIPKGSTNQVSIKQIPNAISNPEQTECHMCAKFIITQGINTPH